MMRFSIGYVAAALLAAGVGGALWVQHEAVAAVRAERDTLREQVRDVLHAREEHERLIAAQASETELAALREDRATAVRVRGQVDAMKRDLNRPQPALAPRPPPRLTPAGEWRNAGRATPAATVETVFWAAAGGDVDALATAVGFDPAQRRTIDAAFAALPEEVRRQYRTPEGLVAFFTTKDIPLSAMRVVGEKVNGSGDHAVSVLFDVPGGKPHATIIAVHRDEDGWRLRVPLGAVQSYFNLLGAAGVTSSPAIPAPAP